MPILCEQVKTSLRHSIGSGQFNVGDVLPTPDELAPRWQCSPETVRKALVELAREGVVRRVQRKGTLVTRKPRLGTITLMQSYDPHLNGLLVETICRKLYRAGYDVDILTHSNDPETTQAMLLRPSVQESDCLLLLSPSSEQLFWPAWQKFRTRVAFSLENQIPDPHTQLITLDHYYAAKLIAEHFLNLGHRSVAVVDPPNNSWVSTSARAFRDFIQVAGAQCQTFTEAESSSQTKIQQLVNDHGVTAIWALNDHYAIVTYSLLHRMGLRVPEDMSIVGRFNTPWSVECPSPLTTISMEPELMADAIVIAIQQAQESDTPHHSFETPQIIRPKLIVRDSSSKAH